MSDDSEAAIRRVAETLRVVSGPAGGAVILVPTSGLRLGREADLAGRLGGDHALSRRHASIRRDDRGRLVVEDLGSTNGTFVNGHRLGGPRVLSAGDVIDLGGSRLEVLAEGASALPHAGGHPAAEDEWGWLGDGPAPTPPAAARLGPPPAPPRPAASRAGWANEQRRGHGSVVGQIRGIHHRTESYGQGGSAEVWTFRLERYDDGGNRLPPVPVQLRGHAFEGALHEGDEVRVTGRWKDGTLHSARVENRTTGAIVKPRSFTKALVAFLIIVALMVGGFAIFVVYSQQAFEQSAEQNWNEFCEQAGELGATLPPGC